MTTCTTRTDGTISANFEALQKKARKMTREALIYSANDAREAAAANPEGPKAGYYLDEAFTYSDEIARRDRLGVK